MNPLLVLLCFFIAGLGIYALVLRRLHRISEAECYWRGVVLPEELKTDVFAGAIASHLFSNDDAEFLSGKAPAQFVRSFDENRAAIAVAWVVRERARVGSQFREYRQTVRAASSITPTEEVKLLGEFLLFQLMSGVVLLLVILRGPSHAERFLKWSSEFAQTMQRFVDRAIPATSATVEVIRPE